MSDYRVLYRKYRSRDFDDVSGQSAITDILKYQVAHNRLAHAYLFCGSRGIGKTSCAKILAKAVNCENPRNGNPCNECEACRSIDAGTATDVIEMDAASNNGVGNVRDMKDEIAFTPAFLKYRVYIIDEVHMMSSSAFNALLKTLEEPPAYVIFILATTEFHKLPTTIVSRCQRYDFRRMTTADIVNRLNKISALEGIDLAPDGAAMLSRVAEGGMRDAISLLELCAGARARIDADLVFRMVGRGSRSNAYNVMSGLLNGRLDTVFSALSEIISKGSDISVFYTELIDAYRDLMVVKTSADAKTYLDLTDAEYELLTEMSKTHSISKLIYHTSVLESTLADLARAKESKRAIAEIAFTKICSPRLESTPEAMLHRIEELEQALSRVKLGLGSEGASQAVPAPERRRAEQSQPTAPAPTAKEKPQASAPEAAAPETVRSAAPYKNWARVVRGIESLKAAIYTPLSRAVAIAEADGSFTIKVDAFFVSFIGNDKDSMSILRGLIADAEGCSASDVRISIVPKAGGESATLQDELFNAIDN